MHCKACDHQLSEKEINWNAELNDWELCSTCLDSAMDAANSSGFNNMDEEEFVVLDEDFDDSFVPALDSYDDYGRSKYDGDYE